MTKENEPGTLLGISVSFGYMWYLRALPRALDSSYPAVGSLLRDTGVGLVCVCVCVDCACMCVRVCSCVRLRMSLSAGQAVGGEAGGRGSCSRYLEECSRSLQLWLLASLTEEGHLNARSCITRARHVCLCMCVCLSQTVSVACEHLWDMLCLDQQWACTCV